MRGDVDEFVANGGAAREFRIGRSISWNVPQTREIRFAIGGARASGGKIRFAIRRSRDVGRRVLDPLRVKAPNEGTQHQKNREGEAHQNHSGSGPRISILYFAQRRASFSKSGVEGGGKTRSAAGTAISVIIPTNPVPGIAMIRMVQGEEPVHRIPCGIMRGRKIYPPGPRMLFCPSQTNVNSPSST